MTITIIAAIARNGAIGRAGTIPWHAPEDLRHFRDVTMGHAVVMGRRTWESLPAKARPLPGRFNVVLSRSPMDLSAFHTFDADECAMWCDSLTSAIWQLQASKCQHIDIIGGARVYREALPLADRLLITEVGVDVPDADAWFPDGIKLWTLHALRAGHPDGWGFGDYVGDGIDMRFRLESRRNGTDPRLTFCEWRRLRRRGGHGPASSCRSTAMPPSCMPNSTTNSSTRPT